MFKKSRRKIVAAIMTILVLLWVGTLGVIYVSSYMEMTRQNTQMLKAHAEMYTLNNEMPGQPGVRPLPDDNHGFKPGFTDSPMFQLSHFYTIALSYEGEVLEIKNGSSAVHTEKELIELAKEIIQSEKIKGTKNNLSFYQTDKGDYDLITFMDNTVVNENAMMLLRFTLIFGAVALVLFFFLSVFLARKIVDPLEAGYKKQKQFISDAGHELKTPVAVVSANAELLSREIGENKWLANIQYENEKMAILIGQLLDLARTENVSPQMENIDFSRLINGEALLFESVAFEKGRKISTDISDGLSVMGNAGQLRQMIGILLDNAISHSEDGEISIKLVKEHGQAQLSVINRGEEIPAHLRKQLFERFFRVDAARSDEDNHYGLGLSIGKAIVIAHKGRIEVLCKDGLVEFRVQIPII